jgi:hypothetical protein
MSDIYYFGCRQVCGHYWHLGTVQLYNGAPWWGEPTEVLPEYPQVQGVVRCSQYEGWNVFSFWDRSVDRRPGSYSLFATKAELSNEEFLKRAQTEYPWVFERLGYELQFDGEKS